jgi:hypothetical protein
LTHQQHPLNNKFEQERKRRRGIIKLKEAEEEKARREEDERTRNYDIIKSQLTG